MESCGSDGARFANINISSRKIQGMMMLCLRHPGVTSFMVCVLLVAPTGSGTRAFGQAAPEIAYYLSFPEPQHRWMQVTVVFSQLPDGPLELRMSRTSPGRYALHEFAKNVFDVRVIDGEGRTIVPGRPSLHGWTVEEHDGTVRVTYRIFGDRIDGTYLAVDATHAHVNMPAALMWARDLADRPARVRFEPPPGETWRVATQLYPTSDPLEFTAPNLQYLMDSPVEFGNFVERTFSLRTEDGSTVAFRLALHHEGTDAEADQLAADVERIVREEIAIIGELPPFETGRYTFLADYLPYANGDGMEHRNSTVLTSSGALRVSPQRLGLLTTIAHEFFHGWNVERIRPVTLEPFDFEQANVSGALWFGEGFTSYYDGLVLHRAGLVTLRQLLGRLAGMINSVILSPGRRLRSAVEMSRLAPFVDAASSIDHTTWENTFVSYYTWGAVIGLGLDLSLRDRSDGRVSLDDYMRAMWSAYGKPDGPAPGVVGTPYTLADARRGLADVSGDAGFAGEFFDRYIDGHEVVDYRMLLARAGLVLRLVAPGRAWLGEADFTFETDGARLAGPARFGSPLYTAGLDRGDLLRTIDGSPINSPAELDAVLRRSKAGDRVTIGFKRRDGSSRSSTATLAEDSHVEIVALEQTGGTLTQAQRTFRDAWLGTQIEK